jgi:hypothetical protein
MNIVTLATDFSDMAGLLIPLGGLLFAAFIIVVAAIKSVAINRARETTKRELAAYMAEGSISAEDAERILKHREDRKCG